MKKVVTLLVCCAFVLCAVSGYAEIKNPDTFIKATVSTIRTIDPAAAYDMASMQKVENIYEKLIIFDGPYTDRFLPLLAEEVPSLENGGISADGKTYTFKLRKGIKFQQGGDLTPEDVEYSIERVMVLDQNGGPAWMLLEALTGTDSSTDKDDQLKPGIFEAIMNAVEVQGDSIVFHLPSPYPPFMGLMAKSWASITDKEWVIAQGGWDGTLENAPKHHRVNSGEETLHHLANGTGPYIMKSWEPTKEFVFERFEEYWGPKPALKYAIFKYVPEWSTRKLMLVNGDVDSATVEDQYVKEMMEIPGLNMYKLPQLSISCAMFCQKIDTTGNPYIGSGQLDGAGIPPDFFTDINVRKAFLHAFDRDIYAEDVLQGISIVPSNPIVQGLPYAIDVPVYEFDLEKSAECLKKAWDGQAWEKGFKMTIMYNTGNTMRESAAVMLAENIMSLNPKFQIEVGDMQWRDYLNQYRQFRFPVSLISWVADYPDPHNFAHPFMHSNGSHGRYLGMPSPETDAMIEEGISTTDPLKRAEIYEKLQHLWYEKAIGLGVYQSTEVRFYRDWVKGFVGNPLDAGDTEWLFRLFKEE